MKRIIKYLSPIFSIYKLNLYKIDKNSPPLIDSSMSSGVKCELEEISYDNYKLAYTIDKESKLDFKSMLKDGDSGVFAFVDGRPVGYLWLKKDGSNDPFFDFENCCYLCRGFVHPDYRGRRLLNMMIKYLVDKYRDLYQDFYVAIAPTNISSIKSCQKVNIKYLRTFVFVRCLRVTFNKYTIKNEI